MRTLATLAFLSSLLFAGACLDDPDTIESDEGDVPARASSSPADFPADSFDDTAAVGQPKQMPGQVPWDRLTADQRPEHAPAPDTGGGVLTRQTGVARADEPVDLPVASDLGRAARARLDLLERAHLLRR